MSGAGAHVVFTVDTSTLPRASHEATVKIGEASFRCYILPGPDGTHVRVLSQRDTLRALGATYNPSVVGKNTEKNGDTKPNVSGIENAKIANDSKNLGGDAKLRFLPPRGGAPVTGYTTAQVIQFLRDWSGRHARGERMIARGAGATAAPRCGRERTTTGSCR